MPIVTPAQQAVEEWRDAGQALPNRDGWISEPAGLTQFGAFVQLLQPGARSALPHWHRDEDELVYLLEGELTLVEGERQTRLQPGDAAAFRAGVPLPHCLWNHSDQPARCLVVGTRARTDRITYPQHDRLLHRDRSRGEEVWTDAAGRPADNPYAD